VQALDFGFPGRTIGRDVSFTLQAGEVMCVLGPNGGGKTTLFRTLLGLLEPHAGSIQLDSSSLTTLSRAEIARRAGYVPQGHAGYFAFTVREFVLMGRTAHLGVFSVPGKQDRQVAERALESLGIARLADKPVTEISGGERQLALVARALAQEPKLLVLDEPTANLDFGNQVRVLQRISALAASGISILFSSHDPDHAFLYARRALLLAAGRVLEIGAPRAVIRPDTLERLYGVSVKVIDLGGGAHTCLPAVGR
ncbi:MAG TPA: ABC transporter ATP-binding protein, partial [Burkholderiales bacterium]|nr:ABC transporter ATP-binding protein [Burkholderiales bacterium]